MKQETGNNSFFKKDNVSVQLMLDGHNSSFILPSIPKGAFAEACILTEKVTLIPSDIFSEELCSEYILKSGISIDIGETIVLGENEGITAVMAIKQDIIKPLMEKYEGNVFFSTPLLPRAIERKFNIYAIVRNNVVFLKAYDNWKLLRAEAVRIHSKEDASYFIVKYMDILFKEQKCYLGIECDKALREEFRNLSGKIKFFNIPRQ
ncbi:MAG: DUF3822 family protein [Alistipes sp.]|nr:DUF3822 family protein [Candidatus Alistipes equi]